MKESEMWEKIARAFEEYANGAPVYWGDFDTRGPEHPVATDAGLCWARTLQGEDLTSNWWNKSLDRLYLFWVNTGDGFFWPTTRKGAANRAIAAQLLAEMAKDEEEYGRDQNFLDDWGL